MDETLMNEAAGCLWGLYRVVEEVMEVRKQKMSSTTRRHVVFLGAWSSLRPIVRSIVL
jgi:hypothetical protein